MSITVTLPVNLDTYEHDLKTARDEVFQTTKTAWKERTWMGRIIEWVHTSNSKGIIQKTLVHAAAVLMALVLMVSIIGTPFLIYAGIEYIRQREREHFNKKIDRFSDITDDLLRTTRNLIGQNLLKGSVECDPKVRTQMIDDLNKLDITNSTGAVPLESLSVGDLLRLNLINNPDYLLRYRLNITG